MHWYGYIWGKTVRQPAERAPDFHHLACHLIDVGVVADELLRSDGARHWLDRLAAALGCEPDALRWALPLLIALHDLGKACPSFQAKSELHAGRLRSADAPWPPAIRERYPHDLELARSLVTMLPELAIFAPELQGRQRTQFWSAVSLGVTAHHGRFFSLQETGELPEIPALEPLSEDWQGQADWVAARRWLVDQVRAVLRHNAFPVPCRPANLSAVAMLLNGFTILCDWIGSDEQCFHAADFPDLAAYGERAREIASAAIADHRLLAYLRPEGEPTFSALFPTRPQPRSVQQAVDKHACPTLPRQTLTIMEAPMGEGKTEAALLLASRQAWQHGYQGLYFALPTVATSNQMYERVKQFLGSQASSRDGVLLAPVNGLSEFNPDVEAALRSHVTSRDSYEEDQTVHYDTWFLPRKRTLLAPYGVGTIDQALLAAMNTRHVGLRLLGLSGKVVIVDEIHAYDLYMSSILDRLLVWLRELGASVILLSATLPSARRAALLQTFARPGAPLPPTPETDYPLITIAERGGESRTLPCGRSAPRLPVLLERRPDGERHRKENAAWLWAEMRPGGRAVWICNTVGEAQAVYRELRRLADAVPLEARPDVMLFHARFLLGDRQDREEQVLSCFGPPADESPAPAPRSQRPSILVATQVVEQSLDLDFDLMVSQLAPIDLLLQRLGRLHRHDRLDRPAGHQQPRLVLLDPQTSENGPSFGAYCRVYSHLILLRTLLTLSRRTGIRLPDDIRSLIEAVYGPEIVLPDDAAARDAGLRRDWFETAQGTHQRAESQQQQEAQIRVLGEPRPNGLFYAAQNELVDDEPAERHLAMQTRLSGPTIRAVLLDDRDPLLAAVRAAAQLDRSVARTLLLRSVSLRHWPLVAWVGEERSKPREVPLTPTAFAATNALRDLVLLPLQDGVFPWTYDGRSHRLRLDPDLGIVFNHEEDSLNEFTA
jgi:CRISPR-associated endonuclease/helicase Cas3